MRILDHLMLALALGVVLANRVPMMAAMWLAAGSRMLRGCDSFMQQGTYVWVCKEFLEVREYIRLPEMGKVAGDAMKNVVKSELGVEFPLERCGKVGHGGGMSSRSILSHTTKWVLTPT